MLDSLWGEDFSLDNNNEVTQKLLVVAKKPIVLKPVASIEKQIKSKKLTLEERLEIVNKHVLEVLGKEQPNTLVIRTRQDFHDYITKAINYGELAVDTETNNSVDYLTCKIMGLCLYVPGEKQVYIPINHTNYRTGVRLDWQLTEQDIKEELQRVLDAKTKLYFHNFKFDYQVLLCTCGIRMTCYWDTMIAAQVLDEREKGEFGLKSQYVLHVDSTQDDYDIESLFDGKNVKYEWVDVDIFALYSAHDTDMTYKLYLYQKEKFDLPINAKPYKVFREIEMPIIEVVAKIELRGIAIDQEYAKRLANKYHRLQKEVTEEVNRELAKLKPTIDAWRVSPEAQKLEGKKRKCDLIDDPINLDSSKQLAILLFDILKFPEGLGQTINDKPRSTGKNIMKILAKQYGFTLGQSLLRKKAFDKLVNTYIDTLPEQVSIVDGKIHCQFHQMGAMARFSSNNPNLQNIPSNIKDIRPMFVADPGKVLVACDMSAAEVRACVHCCREPLMIEAYQQGKDLYAVIGSKAYKKSYDDCLEFYPEFRQVIYEGKTVRAGNEKKYILDIDETNSIILPSCYLIQTPNGSVEVDTLKISDKVTTDGQPAEIINIINIEPDNEFPYERTQIFFKN